MGEFVSAFVKDTVTASRESSFPERKPDFRSVDFEAQARQVLDDAQRQGAAIERRAYEEGFEKGERAGLALGKEQLIPTLEELQQLTQSLANAKDEVVRSMEKDIVRLALSIAERVVHAKIAEDDAIVLDAVRAAIAEFTDRGTVEIFAAATQEDLIRTMRPELLDVDGIDEVIITADDTIRPGGCRVRTKNGFIDATVDTALSSARRIAV